MRFSAKSSFGLLACTALTGVGLVATPAHAQEGAADDSGLDVIIVTAQKREQSVQDVPIAVTAVSGDTLEVNRVVNVTDLSALAPGVTVRTSAGGTALPSFIIRGAVSYGVVPGSDKQVSMYLDGVYLSNPRGTIFDLPDIQRIEILRGPQGTLFGRNATAGAVSISTRDPKDEFGVTLKGTIGNQNEHRAAITVDLPKIGPLSGFVSFLDSHRRGDVRNAGAGQVWDRTASRVKIQGGIATSPEWLGTKDSQSWFAALKFESGDFKSVYKFDRYDAEGTPEATGFIGYNPDAFVGPLPAGLLIKTLLATQSSPVNMAPDGKRPKVVNNSWVVPNKALVEGHSLTTSYQVSDSVSVKNITAFRKSNIWATSSLDGLASIEFTAQAAPFLGIDPTSPAGAFVVGAPFAVLSTQSQSRSQQWSSEFQLNYDSDFLTATAGAVWFQGKDWTQEGYLQGSGFFDLKPGGIVSPRDIGPTFNKATSIAAYTQLEFHLTPQLDIILGGRITRDKKSGWAIAVDSLADLDNLVPNVSYFEFTYKKTKPNYMVSVNYKPTEDILVYGKYSTAFVSGGAVGPLGFPPETATSWEGGVKAELLDRKLRANLAVYRAKYKNFQTAQSAVFVAPYVTDATGDPNLASNLGTIVVPLGDAVINKGFEADFVAAPLHGVTVGGQLGYSKTTFKGVNPILLAAVYAGRADPTLRPKWTGGLWGQIETEPLFGDAYMSFRLDGLFQSRVTMTDNPPRIMPWAPAAAYEPSYWLLNGRVALRDIDFGGVNAELAVWGKNLTDEGARTFQLAPLNTIAGANYIPARAYGVDLTVKY